MIYWGNKFNPNEKFYIVNKVYVEQIGIKISRYQEIILLSSNVRLLLTKQKQQAKMDVW